MRIYVAAAWSRRDLAQYIAEIIEDFTPHKVVSRWLTERPAPNDPAEREKFLQETAQQDLDDIKNCDALVRLSDDLSGETVPAHLATGARMWECGEAHRLGKMIVVVGGKQCLFDHLPEIVHVKGTVELLRFLNEWK